MLLWHMWRSRKVDSALFVVVPVASIKLNLRSPYPVDGKLQGKQTISAVVASSSIQLDSIKVLLSPI